MSNVIGFKAFKNTLKRDSGYAPVSGENGYSVIRCVFPVGDDWDDIEAVSAGFFVHPKDIAVVTEDIAEGEERAALFTIPGALLKQGERLHFGLFATVNGVTIATNTVVLDVARGIVSDDIDYDPTEAAGMFEQFSNALNTALLGKANKATAGTAGELAALDGNGSPIRSGVSVAQSVGEGSTDEVPTTAAVKTALDGKADKLVDGDNAFTDRILIASNNGGIKNSNYTINNARLSGDVNLTVPSSNVVANALAGKADKAAAGTDGELAAVDGNGAMIRSGFTVAESVGGGSNNMVPTTEAVRQHVFSMLDEALNGSDDGAPSLFVRLNTQTGKYQLVYEDSNDDLHVLFDFGLLPSGGTSNYNDLSNKPEIMFTGRRVALENTLDFHFGDFNGEVLPYGVRISLRENVFTSSLTPTNNIPYNFNAIASNLLYTGVFKIRKVDVTNLPQEFTDAGQILYVYHYVTTKTYSNMIRMVTYETADGVKVWSQLAALGGMDASYNVEIMAQTAWTDLTNQVGYTLTPQDKADIANFVLQMLPTTQGVLYGNTSN